MIIPIGTKSNLAMRPVATFALLILNVIVAAITLPLDHRVGSRLFDVQRGRFAIQLELYDAQYLKIMDGRGPAAQGLRESLDEVDASENYFDLEFALLEATGYLGMDIDEFLDYGDELLARKDSGTKDLPFHVLQLYQDWQIQYDKEAEVLNSSPANSLGLVPTKMGRIHTWITYQFVHADIMHLLGNLLFLWVVGALLEDTWGRLPFLIFYLLGGMVAAAFHSFQDMSSTIPLIGASGAIAAAMGAFAIRHFKTRIRMFYFFIILFRPFWGTFFLPAFVFLPLWLGEQILMQYVTTYVGATGVAYLAHIAGFGFGVFGALALGSTGVEKKILATRVQNSQIKAGVLRDPRLDDAQTFFSEGKTDAGLRITTAALKERPSDVNAMLDILQIYRAVGLRDEYCSLADQALKRLLMTSQYEEATILVRDALDQSDLINEDPEFMMRPTPMKLNPQALMKLGKWMADEERVGEAHDIYVAAREQADNPLTEAKTGMALARLMAEKMNRRHDALQLLDELGEISLPEEWKLRFEELAEELGSDESDGDQFATRHSAAGHPETSRSGTGRSSTDHPPRERSRADRSAPIAPVAEAPATVESTEAAPKESRPAFADPWTQELSTPSSATAPVAPVGSRSRIAEPPRPIAQPIERTVLDEDPPTPQPIERTVLDEDPPTPQPIERTVLDESPLDSHPLGGRGSGDSKQESQSEERIVIDDDAWESLTVERFTFDEMKPGASASASTSTEPDDPRRIEHDAPDEQPEKPLRIEHNALDEQPARPSPSEEDSPLANHPLGGLPFDPMASTGASSKDSSDEEEPSEPESVS